MSAEIPHGPRGLDRLKRLDPNDVLFGSALLTVVLGVSILAGSKVIEDGSQDYKITDQGPNIFRVDAVSDNALDAGIEVLDKDYCIEETTRTAIDSVPPIKSATVVVKEEPCLD